MGDSWEDDFLRDNEQVFEKIILAPHIVCANKGDAFEVHYASECFPHEVDLKKNNEDAAEALKRLSSKCVTNSAGTTTRTFSLASLLDLAFRKKLCLEKERTPILHFMHNNATEQVVEEENKERGITSHVVGLSIDWLTSVEMTEKIDKMYSLTREEKERDSSIEGFLVMKVDEDRMVLQVFTPRFNQFLKFSACFPSAVLLYSSPVIKQSEPSVKRRRKYHPIEFIHDDEENNYLIAMKYALVIDAIGKMDDAVVWHRSGDGDDQDEDNQWAWDESKVRLIELAKLPYDNMDLDIVMLNDTYQKELRRLCSGEEVQVMTDYSAKAEIRVVMDGNNRPVVQLELLDL